MAGLAKAKLIELDQKFEKEKSDGHQVEVQFNPESLKVTFANQLVQPEGGNQAAGNAGRQFVGAGTTKLALQLWFDVTAMEKDPVDDVRRLTQKVIFFMTPQKSEAEPDKLAPPGLRFQWGSFLFDGMVEGLEETLEFFSPEGKPLRASINLTCSQQKILEAKFEGEGRVPTKPGKAPPGQAPLKAAKQNESLANLAGKQGKKDWQGIAAANGIEDPLRLSAGQLVDLNAGFSVDGGLSAGASLGGSVNAALGGSVGGSLGGSVGGSIGGSVGAGGSVGLGVGGGIGSGIGASVSGGASGGGLNASLGGTVSGSMSFG